MRADAEGVPMATTGTHATLMTSAHSSARDSEMPATCRNDASEKKTSFGFVSLTEL